MTLCNVAITTGSEAGYSAYDNYAAAIQAVGGKAWYVSPKVEVEAAFDQLDCLLITGGADISPTHYNGHTGSYVYSDYERDLSELKLFEYAWKHNIPTLAICRGFQLINVARGGVLQQHIDNEAHRPIGDENTIYHEVALESYSIIRKLLGSATIRTNSRHHQGVRPNMVGRGLVVSGMSGDGLVESVESPLQNYCVGVQWHPERVPDLAQDHFDLFHALVLAGQRYLCDRQRYSPGAQIGTKGATA